MAVNRVERETEAFQALRELQTQAMNQGGLLDVIELQRRLREESLEAIDHLPRSATEQRTRVELAAFLLDTFIPKYRSSMAAYRYIGD